MKLVFEILGAMGGGETTSGGYSRMTRGEVSGEASSRAGGSDGEGRED